ncbi:MULTISPECIES: bifunctional adenosylcobinamide kinase/adenosylcobinamide-phosphate guanylyltransferase [unclassified Sphingomonas]|uniref:bifunctional adenosylcobinamide kinase/adenosylcobinamide-phosphate guanylyltransferase n=1 Tax=unclassified Sphingomonas TaxID=196159 RepID=UPI00190F52C0|nr:MULTISPECIES: bifunctional adenosylcobinamide kinase/adenosylcobinamide-phosphate guanylyltransferase [unclassified Sphingomonas]MDY1006797.1 bifunctional adenosylcobinamide kinase/adenosylcobinamide-phosphate guanylyltransferase [Sphingomonas sp. CFBP9019]
MEETVVQGFGKTVLVTGGARSGKSRHAQALAEAAGGHTLVYIATAQAFDGEMTERIARHRSERDERWRTVEAPLALAAAIVEADAPDGVILVDCLTLWASNLMLTEADADTAIAALLDAIGRIEGRLVLVTNEVGMGIVPDNAMARRFRDLAGMLNQRVAAAVETVDLAVSGLTIRMKG